MSRFQDLSIQRKLMALMMLTTVLALVLAATAFFVFDVYTFREKIVDDLRTLAETVKANTTNALVYNDVETATMILTGLDVQPHILSASVFDREGTAFAEFHRGGVRDGVGLEDVGDDDHRFADDRLVLQRPILFNGRELGTFQIVSDLGEIRQRLRSYLGILAGVVLGISLLAFFFSSRLQRVVSGPILELATLARTVSEKRDYSVRAKDRGRDEIGRLVAGFNDMLTQIQARDEDLRVARDRAEQANRTKSVFLANMSHELRTPLTAIIGYSEILEDDAQDLGLKDFLPDLQKIKAAGKHLLGLINSILDLSKVEAGKMELYVETFDVPSLISEVSSTVMPLMEKRGNTLEIRCAEDLGTIATDQTKARQVLFNLLSNASKFTENGRVVLEAGRGASEGVDGFLFRISDTGIGMTEEQMGRLFKPFSQADASTARNFGGTGLGLALCKRFCQVMRGRIEVSSEIGSGSTFTVWLPAEVGSKSPKSVHQMLAESGEWQKTALRQRAEEERAVSSKLVLVIDDDLAVHELLEGVMKKEGYRVESASDGIEGLKKARQMRPDIITLDVYMPGKDGWTVLGELKADPELSEIPVIMISVSDERQKGYAMGAEYLTKPIDRKKLAAMLSGYRGAESRPTALVVDDDPSLREMLRRNLEEQGWGVDEAENGVAALRRVAENPPHLILLDLIMPQLDGFGFIAQLRKNVAWRGIPIVVVTAKDLGAEERERLNGGVERVLQKGAYSLEELKNEIRSLARDRLQA